VSSGPLVVVLMGVSGCGKSTVASALASRLGWDVLEGDSLHSPANVAKMASGQPLTDADRSPWLSAIAAWIAAQTESGKPGVVTCSALKRAYRDRLRAQNVLFIYLRCSRPTLQARLTHRHGHFMQADLLDSQLDTLEEPGPDEWAITIDANGDTSATTVAIVNQLPSQIR
jgi:carbohydrate kinase (thermoresistant glucokinase family)